MLPRSRVLSVLLLGLGAALIAAGLLAPRLIHGDSRLPLDFGDATWTIHDEHATTRVLQDPARRVFEAPVTHQLHMTVEEPSTDETATVRVGSTFLRDSLQQEQDRLMDATVWNWLINRVNGKPESPVTLSYQMASPTIDIETDGVWLKFPSQLDAKQGTTFNVMDETLRRATPADFVDTENLHGRDVAIFRQEISPIDVAREHQGVNTTMSIQRGEEPDQQAHLFHSAVRDFHVDQETGLVLAIDENIEDFYGTPEGEPLEPALTFHGTMDDAQVADLAQRAESMTQVGHVGLWGWLTAGLGAVLLLLGVLGAFLAGGQNAQNPSTRGPRRRVRGR